jgi:autotransporter-associated beta strand protein
MSLGSGAITVLGSGFVNLNAANSFSGGTTVSKGNDGALVLYNINALGTGGLTVNSGVVNLNYQSISIPSLSGTGGIITDTGAAGTTTLTVTQSVDTTYSGVIANGASRTVALVKGGSGTLTLAGRNTYSGATTINAGGLIVVTGGSSVNGPVTVADGASNGVRVASMNGQWACSNLTYSAGTTTLDIDFGSAVPSATIAPLRVANDLNMGTVGISVRNGLWPATPGIYPLVSYSRTLSGTVPASALSLPAGVTATLVNNTGSKRIDLNVTAVNWAPSSYNTWTNLVSGNASGTWGTAANWSNSIPDSVDAMADFSTLNITAGAYVNNEAPRTVGQLRFGDTTPGNDWVLTNAALTLATTVVQPVIDVSNGNASINSVLLGTQGFVKQGSGTLWISGKSTMAGDITVSQGMLGNTLGGLRWTTGNVIVSTGATLYATSGWGDGDSHAMPNPIFLSGTGMNANYGALHGQANFDCNGPITLLTDSKISHDWNNFSLNGAITGTDKNLILSAENATSQPGLWVNGSMSLGSGAITVIGSGYVRLNAAHSFSGGTTVSKGNDGALVLYNINALGTGGLTVNRGVVDLNYQSISIPSLSGTGGRITDAGAAGTTTLTVNQATNTTYSGVITNGATRVLALVKSGSGLLTLSATNTYTGATAISNGTLAVNGALSSSGVTVCTGAAFAAGTTGVVGRAVLGGTLAFQDTSRLLVDVASVTADAVVAAGDVVIGTGVEVRLSGNQEKSGSWEIIKSTAGTVQGSDPVLIGGLHGAKLSRTTTAIVLTIPPMGTMIRVL